MNTKQLANDILTTLLNELSQLARNKYEQGHDSCFSREDVAGLCERGANNLAMILPALVPNQFIEIRDGEQVCPECLGDGKVVREASAPDDDGCKHHFVVMETGPALCAFCARPNLSADPVKPQELDVAQAQAQHYTNRLINRIGGRSADIKEAAVDIDKALDRLQRQMQAERAAVAAIAAEGSPAVKDAFGLYMQASDELMKEAEKMQNAAGDELRALREVVRS